MNDPMPMLIDGEPVAGGATFAVEDPSSGETAGFAPDCGPGELEQAVEAARHAWPEWKAEVEARRLALIAIEEALVAAGRRLGATISAEQGKPIVEARQEAAFAAQWLRYYAELPQPEEVLQDDDARIEVRRQSLGPVAAIIPWNFPIGTAFMKIAPALAAGNTVVLKSSPFTPLSMLEAAAELRTLLPPGVLNVVSGGDELGAALIRHPEIRKVTLTGSIPAGKAVGQSAAADLKRVTLELGGNDPALVLPDADPDAVAAALAAAAFRNCGQICNAPKRVYAPRALADRLAAALAERANALRVGPAQDETTEMGPLATTAQLRHVVALVNDARRAGAEVVNGGQQLPGPGNFYAPTVIAGAEPGMRVVDEEQFGPVLPVIAYDDLETAIRSANDTHFGLGASVWTSDPASAAPVVDELEAGTVWVNTHSQLRPDVPMTGTKWSGVGVEHGELGLEAYLDLKVTWQEAPPTGVTDRGR